MRWLLLFVVAVALCAPAGASAAVLDGNVLAQARGAWPASSCMGAEKVAVNEALVRSTYPKRPEVIAFATSGCRVVLGDWIMGQSQTDLCDVLVHEFGHLALSGTDADHVPPGVFPSSSPMATMTEETGHWDGCGLPAPSREQLAIAALRARFAGKRWTCDEDLWRCVVKIRRSRVRTVLVSDTGGLWVGKLRRKR